jgi:trehalose 6-phosphate phosphatase
MAALPHTRSGAGAAGLAALVGAPARALVALDFDGTLAPIVDEPSAARPLPGALPAMARVHQRIGTLAVLTGRPAQVAVDLGGFAGAPGLGRLVVLGLYGHERWDAATGRLTTRDAAAGLAPARAQVAALLATSGSRAELEDKGLAITVHTRRTPDPDGELARLREPLLEIGDRCGLAVEPGRYVLELRTPGMDKGSALRALARERGATAVLFAGDDLGDLAAYDAVEGLRKAGLPGVTVCSRSAEAAAVAARADIVVDGPAGVVALLDGLAALLGR